MHLKFLSLTVVVKDALTRFLREKNSKILKCDGFEITFSIPGVIRSAQSSLLGNTVVYKLHILPSGPLNQIFHLLTKQCLSFPWSSLPGKTGKSPSRLEWLGTEICSGGKSMSVNCRHTTPCAWIQEVVCWWKNQPLVPQSWEEYSQQDISQAQMAGSANYSSSCISRSVVQPWPWCRSSP